MEPTILYSFRRCPYAMRARMAIASASFPVQLREIKLREKPSEMLAASPKATVPVLVLPDQTVLEESLDIMNFVLSKNDPECLLPQSDEEQAEFHEIISECDGPFKRALDRTKYANRYPDSSPEEERAKASHILRNVERRLVDNNGHLVSHRVTLAEIAFLPFIRQFAFIDKTWFDAQAWPNLVAKLDEFINGSRFLAIMKKYPQWSSSQEPLIFPHEAQNIARSVERAVV